MKHRFHLILSLLLTAVSLSAQHANSPHIEQLDSVLLVSPFSPVDRQDSRLVQVGDSTLFALGENLTRAGRKHLHLFFKEYGNGMLSTVSSRGAYASHTGVYWNGIRFHSALNGQVDFNSLSPTVFDGLVYRKGGSSVMLGSGAMSGALNLQNTLDFQSGYVFKSRITAGSFDTYSTAVKAGYGSKRFAARTALHYLYSDNDYPFPGFDIINENGEIRNFSATAGAGFRTKKNDRFYLHGIWISSGRNLSRTVHAPAFSHLQQKNTGITTGWKFRRNKWKNHLQAALTGENYRFMTDTRYPEQVSTNESRRFTIRYNTAYALLNHLTASGGASYEKTAGEGDNIDSHTRDIFAFHGGIYHRLSRSFHYHLHVRKDLSPGYAIPWTYAADISWQPRKQHRFSAGISSNFRLPTFNDLYWTTGGNPGLKPEYSHTVEGGYLAGDRENFFLSVEAYYTRASNLIRWVPGANGLWQPENILDTEMKGLETGTGINIPIPGGNADISAYYRYTSSINAGTGKQLIYIPLHQWGASVSAVSGKWRMDWGYRYTGKIYTTTSQTMHLPGYGYHELILSRTLWKNKITLQTEIKNLFDKHYQIIPDRPMPGRHYRGSVIINL